METIKNLFDKEKVNSGRQIELDLLRGFTLILLVICHVALFLCVDDTSPLYYFADLIGSEPAAPVFMVLMGINVIYSRKQDALSLLKRGVLLLIGAYALNLIRSFPYWIYGDIDYFACLNGFFVDDIFQFAGLTFIFFALFKAIKIPSWGVFIIAICFTITAQILMPLPDLFDSGKPWTYLLNLILPLESDWCCFPFLIWFSFPSFGLVIGDLLIRCKNKNKFYLILLVPGIIGVLALYLNIIIRFPNYVTYYYGGNYYLMGVLEVLITILFVCFGLSFWHFISNFIPNIIKRFLTFLSKNLTFIYVVSWIEISLIIHIQAINCIEFPVFVIILLIFAVLISCALLTPIYRKIKNKIKNKKNKASIESL